MREISPEEAKDKFGVFTRHHELDLGGEKRFRLYKNDGTGYIRTDRSEAKGEWQEGHWHDKIMETYIIQCGWIGFAELIEGALKVQVLKEGAIVTTRPGISHNVYMPNGAVIHTVKHGIGEGEDRMPDKNITQMTKGLSESAIHTLARQNNGSTARAATTYCDEYRHFDNLIWQLPGWSTAVFLGAAAILGQANVQSAQKLMPGTNLMIFVVGFLAIVFMFLLGLTQVLVRFRRHQRPLKIYSRTPWYSSASTYLQLFVTIQAFSVLFLLLVISGVSAPWAGVICAVITIVLSIIRERALRSSNRAGQV
ncbi:MAG: hypothetical protein NUV55_01240 [Sulfuricaulis sp.]|uniref:hypothetical protein n=1 Tax=Sulfuricaulis sp. TaxID=2003553 RepID=UPI0025F720DF|nr:hypothetical protein [Sulfuricaulis sp.]MCR4345819.1 hypothetical protein [Sulfuricaulis sp.]